MCEEEETQENPEIFRGRLMHFVLIRLGNETYREHRDVCVSRAIELANQNGHTYSIVTDVERDRYIKPHDLRSPLCSVSELSDIVRFKMACEIPDLLYLDTDCYLRSIPVFDKKDKPYFVFGDIFIFYVNNCCNMFSEWLDRRRKKFMGSATWFFHAIDYFNECYIIPDACYVHGFFTTQGIRAGLQRLEVVR